MKDKPIDVGDEAFIEQVRGWLADPLWEPSNFVVETLLAEVDRLRAIAAHRPRLVDMHARYREHFARDKTYSTPLCRACGDKIKDDVAWGVGEDLYHTICRDEHGEQQADEEWEP